MIGQKPRVPAIIKGFELTPVRPLSWQVQYPAESLMRQLNDDCIRIAPTFMSGTAKLPEALGL
jgi:hypothetical protein